MLMPRRSHHTESLESWNKLCREAKEHGCLSEWTAVSRARETTGQKPANPALRDGIQGFTQEQIAPGTFCYLCLGSVSKRPQGQLNRQSRADVWRLRPTAIRVTPLPCNDTRRPLFPQCAPSRLGGSVLLTSNVAAHPLRHVNKAGTLRMHP